MLIGIDASRANREHKSGTEWYSYHLIKNLARIDSRNKYILYSDKPLAGGLSDLSSDDFSSVSEAEPQFDKSGYQIIQSPYKNFKAKILNWPFLHFWTLGRFSLEMLFSKPDVLFVPAHTLPFFIPKKTITTIHDIAFARDSLIYREEELGSENKKYRKIINISAKITTGGKYRAMSIDYLKWSTQRALKKAKRVVTISNFSKNEILEVYGEKYKNKISVVYNGYNKRLYRQIENGGKIADVLSKYDITRPYLLYVGRLEKKKNTPALIEAFAMAKEDHRIKEKLVLIGDASFGYDEAKYVIGEYDIKSEVIMPGWVAEEDLPYIYAGATAFIFPSKYEGFGIPVLQAMGCQIPVAASDIPPIREVAQDSIIYFNPKDLFSIKKAIIKIIRDEELRRELITRGRQRAEMFSWRKAAKEILGLINNL